MFNQSFSVQNLKSIVNFQNRNGVYLEKQFFPDAVSISKQIVELNKELREQRKIKKGEEYRIYFKEKMKIKDDLLKQRAVVIEKKLNCISKKISENNISFHLTKAKTANGKYLYTLEPTAESFFTLKYIQYALSRTYKVHQKNRNIIINQILSHFRGKPSYPFYLVRTDVKDFYESINTDKVLAKINRENLIIPTAKRIINQLIQIEYLNKHNNTKGLPRGLGISAYLSEIFMSPIDEKIKKNPNVIFYSRYVDDIFVLFRKSENLSCEQAHKYVQEEIEREGDLKVNSTKTKSFEVGTGQNKNTDYLGYNLQFSANGIAVTISNKRLEKLKIKIDRSFGSYHAGSKISEKKARKLLKKRIRFLTGNTRLYNRKKNVLVGSYFSNKFITDLSKLQELDKHLKDHFSKSKFSAKLTHLGQFSFEDGFNSKKFHRFTPNELKKIVECWEYV